jgi:catechol-2,3-dioxygenase
MMHSALLAAVLSAKDLPRLTKFYSAVTGLQVSKCTLAKGFAV